MLESFPTRLPHVGVLVQVEDRFLYPSQPTLWLDMLLWRLEVPSTSWCRYSSSRPTQADVFSHGGFCLAGDVNVACMLTSPGIVLLSMLMFFFLR